MRPRAAPNRLIAAAGLLTATMTTVATAQLLPGVPASPREKGPDELARMSLLPERVGIPVGGSAWVLVRLAIEPKWHVYWRNPGDSGVPIELKWTLPAGISAGEIRWPRPEVFRTPYEITYGYADEVGLLVELKASEEIGTGARSASIRGDWMICKEMCLIGGADRTFEIEVSGAVEADATDSDRVPITDSEAFAAIARWQAQVPVAPPEKMKLRQMVEFPNGFRADANENAGVLRLSGPAGRFSEVRFLPDATPGTTYPEGGPVEGRVASGRFEVEVPISVRPGDALGEALRVAGIVCLGNARTDPAFEIEVPIGPPTAGGSTAP